MGEGWQLLKIRGIPLRIHPSWFVILLLATAAFQQDYSGSLAGSLGAGERWALGLVTAVLLFLSVLLHELGHSLVALAQGVQVRSITLFLLGGVASVERECNTAIGALLVAAAGPAVSLLLGFGLLASGHGAAHLAPWLGEMVTRLGSLNLLLAFFNLLPGLPLDGGLIVKALVWQVSGSQRRGIVVANSCGRFLSYLAVGLGAVLLLRGGGISGAWLMLLGWFGLGAARNQSQMLALQSALNELRVRDAARRRFRVLEADASLRDLSRLRLADRGDGGGIAVGGGGSGGSGSGGSGSGGSGDWLLVCDRGRWRGYITDDPLQQLPVQRWDGERVGDHLQPLAQLPAIPEGAPLWQAVQQFDQRQCSRLLVLSPAGLPSGTLDKPDLGEAVLARLGLRLPPPLLEAARRQNAYPLGLALPQVVQSMLASGEAREASGASR